MAPLAQTRALQILGIFFLAAKFSRMAGVLAAVALFYFGRSLRAETANAIRRRQFSVSAGFWLSASVAFWYSVIAWMAWNFTRVRFPFFLLDAHLRPRLYFAESILIILFALALQLRSHRRPEPVLSESFFVELESALSTKGYAVFPNFLLREFALTVHTEIVSLRAAGKFRPASIGKGAGTQHAPETRGDVTCWFEPTALSRVQAELTASFAAIRDRLNQSLFLGLWDWEGHYAIYPEGAFYRRHVDRFKNDSRRALSIVIFFNSEWTLADGGALRLETSEGDLDVAPVAGTAVFFLSDRIPHEVLETRRERFSFAGWFRTRA